MIKKVAVMTATDIELGGAFLLRGYLMIPIGKLLFRPQLYSSRSTGLPSPDGPNCLCTCFKISSFRLWHMQLAVTGTHAWTTVVQLTCICMQKLERH